MSDASRHVVTCKSQIFDQAESQIEHRYIDGIKAQEPLSQHKMSPRTISRELFIELLALSASQPHSRCVYRSLHRATRQPISRTIQLRRASSASPAPPPKLKAPPKSPPSPKTRPVPLSVGLDRNPENRSSISRIPIPRGERNEQFTPSPLTYPLGLNNPPQPGQNAPFDSRSWSERKQDFHDPTKNYERRQVYLRTFLRPYFQEWRRTEHYKGKSFVSNERLFRRDKAKYFPNIWGNTLDPSETQGRDMSPLLRGKISVVGVVQGQWAEEQVATFIGEEQNKELASLMESSHGRVQRADVNMQGDAVRAWLVKMFQPNLRKAIPEDRWGRYFMVKLPRDVRRGLTDEVRDAMGLLNTQVGYVYLLDEECRIRWAGSGHAWDGERESLNNGVRRLLQEQSEKKQSGGAMASNASALKSAAESATDMHHAPVEPTAAAV